MNLYLKKLEDRLRKIFNLKNENKIMNWSINDEKFNESKDIQSKVS